MAQVYGVSRVFLDSVDHRTKPGSLLELGGRVYSPQYASGVFAGFSYAPIVSRLICKFEVMGATDIRALHTGFNDGNGGLGGQVEVVTDVGITFYFLPAKIVEPPRVSDAGGGVECTIEGATSEYLGPNGVTGAVANLI